LVNIELLEELKDDMKTQYIFQLGMICAGSTSLCKALNILGIPSLHYRGPDGKVFESEIIPNNIKSNRRLFHPYDQQFTGFLDFNGRNFYKILYEMYPDSKFIYTWRAYDPWLKSALKLAQNQWRDGTPVGIGPTQIVPINNNQDMPEKEFSLIKTARQNYWKINQEIPEFFKNDPRFLEMRICDGNNDGWEKLCNFLGKDIPNVDFPNTPSNNFIFPNAIK
jgi:hypothetical protein